MSPTFATLHAAEIAHVEPWELDRQPMFWQNHILEKANVEAEAKRELDKREARRRARQGRKR